MSLLAKMTSNSRLAKQGVMGALRFGKTMRVISPRVASWALQRRKPSAVEVRETVEQLGTTYIKLGQLIASSPSVFPADYVEAFQDCLDNVEPIAFKEVFKVMQRDLDKPIDSLFSFIDPEPLASASIAQVHAATLVTGESVVVKVQKPGVEDIISTDMNAIFLMSRVAELISPNLSKDSITDMVGALYQSMADECDFIKEADNLENFNHFLREEGITEVTAPKPYRRASSKKVLTMERFEGVPLTDYEKLGDYTDDPAGVLLTGMNTWIASLMKCEVFHADLHGGNIMLLTDGRLGFIDFGMVGRIEADAWQAIFALMRGIDSSDYQLVAESMIKVGMTAKTVDVNRLARDIEELIKQSNGIQPGSENELGDGVNQLIMEIAELGKAHGIRFPPSFTLLLKQFLYFDRYTQQLLPGMDPFSDSRVNF